MVTAIYVMYRDTRTGRSELAYASDMATQFGIRLVVLVPEDLSMDWDALDEFVESNTFSKLGVYDYYSVSNTTIGSRISSDGILVGGSDVTTIGTISLLIPFEESMFIRDIDVKEILIPFGDGDSGVRAAEYGVILAKQIVYGLELWHTTWIDTTVSSDDMSLHMCEGAKDILLKLRRLCEEHGVLYRCVIEGARDVSEGMVRATLRGRVFSYCNGTGKWHRKRELCRSGSCSFVSSSHGCE
ncbi:MAG: hypothetical protein HZA36_02300 [Parcubacteria group bacterium]|nr:hypothetical protein [Parcubacteria group bacterium]